MARKADDGRVVCRPDGDHANGPYGRYLEEEADMDRSERARRLPMHICAHERDWESSELSKIAREHRVPAEFSGALVQVLYLGRESNERERPGADRARAISVYSLADRIRRAITAAVADELQSTWRRNDGPVV